MSDFSDAFSHGQQSALQQAEMLDIDHYGTVLVAPSGRAVHSLERLQPEPSSVRAAVDVYTPASFAIYLQRFSDPRTVIFVNSVATPPVISAVLDYHSAAAPSWGRHRVNLITRITDAWQEWCAASRPQGQTAFAEFIENHVPDIADPPGSTILDIVQTFEVKRGINVSSAIRLDNGQTQFVYDEQISGTSQRGSVTVPAQFILGLAPFEGADKYRIVARFRYRLERGQVSMWVDLDQPDRIMRAAFEDRIEAVRTALKDTAWPVLQGIAPTVALPLAVVKE